MCVCVRVSVRGPPGRARRAGPPLSRSRAEGGGRRLQGGPGLLLREAMRREGRRRWRSRRGSAVWRPWLLSARLLSPPPTAPAPAPFPPPRPRLPVTLLGELWRGGGGGGGSPGGPVILRTHRARRLSGFASAASAGSARPAGGRGNGRRCRRARSDRPWVLAAPAKCSPGLGNAPKRPRLFLLGQRPARGVRNARFWPQPRVAPFEAVGWVCGERSGDVEVTGSCCARAFW